MRQVTAMLLTDQLFVLTGDWAHVPYEKDVVLSDSKNRLVGGKYAQEFILALKKFTENLHATWQW